MEAGREAAVAREGKRDDARADRDGGSQRIDAKTKGWVVTINGAKLNSFINICVEIVVAHAVSIECVTTTNLGHRHSDQ